MMKLIYVSILILCVVTKISSTCQKAPTMIKCDSLEDLQRYPTELTNLPDWSVVQIGSAKSSNDAVRSVDLKETFMNFPIQYPIVLSIVGQINDFLYTEGQKCTVSAPLQILKFHRNKISVIRTSAFPFFENLKMLIFSNNYIENIEQDALSDYALDIFDLSSNLLSVIEPSVLPEARAIYLDNNRITEIKPGSFSSNVEELYLNNNKLRFMKREVLAKLTKLKSLSLRGNQFKTRYADFFQFSSIAYLDLSGNNITKLKPVRIGSHLEVLNLAHNQISDANQLLKSVFTNRQNNESVLEISLMFNKLTSIKLLPNRNNVTVLYFYGNPWDCNFMQHNKDAIKLLQSHCDGLLGTLTEKGVCPKEDKRRSRAQGNFKAKLYWKNEFPKKLGKFEKIINKKDYDGSCHFIFQKRDYSIGCSV